MNREEFRQRLKNGPLLLDGAMGTILHERGIPIDACFDAINFSDPALVADIHRRYIEAGADIIETNSFGANRFKLAQHGLENQVVAINQASVTVARKAIQSSFKDVLLAGAVGPLGVYLAPLGRVKSQDAKAAFLEQIGALTETVEDLGVTIGVDLIVLETIPDLTEMELAIEALRSVTPNLPVIGMITFTRDDRTVLGDTPNNVAARMADFDLDAIGVNCSGGPVQVLQILTVFRDRLPNYPLVAAPNAGWPQQQDGGRVLYPATPDYFGGYARAFIGLGVQIIGGCCGTNQDHIAMMRQAIDEPDSKYFPVPRISIRRRSEPLTESADQPSRLSQALHDRQFVVTVEMSPPRGIAAKRLLVGARTLKEAGANFVNVADNPLARMRMSAWAAAHLIQRDIELETILHFPTRGRNLLRIQGDLLAAHALNIRNLFVIMGDPTHIGDYPEAMNNYDIVPTGLVRLIKEQLNMGLDQAGQTIDQPTSFTVGCALNLESQDISKEMRLFRKKIFNGADFVITQPIFDPSAAKDIFTSYVRTTSSEMLPVIAGIQPLYSYANAEFLHYEVPGINIPDHIRERMARASNPQNEGVRIACEILEELKSTVQGVYMIPVFGRYDLVADVLDKSI